MKGVVFGIAVEDVEPLVLGAPNTDVGGFPNPNAVAIVAPPAVGPVIGFIVEPTFAI